MKYLLLLLLFFSIIFPIAAQTANIVVLLDVSESVFSIFSEIYSYFFYSVLTRYLDFGDTIHILVFADTPRTEIVKTVNNQSDIEEIIERLLLTYPFGQYTDLISALHFLDEYIENSISRDSDKIVVILTDGIHDPPPGSPYTTAKTALKRESTAIGRKLKEKNLDLNIITVEPPQKKKREIISTIQEETDATVTKLEEDIIEEESGRLNDTPSEESREQTETVQSKEKGESLADSTPQERSRTLQSGKRTEPGEQAAQPSEEIVVQVPEKEGVRESAAKENDEMHPSFSLQEDSENPRNADDKERDTRRRLNGQPDTNDRLLGMGGKKLRTVLLVMVPSLLIVGFIIISLVFLRNKELLSVTNLRKGIRMFYRISNRPLKADDRPIELRVIGQNPNIGMRNVRRLRDGQKMSIGGYGSDFLIFLVPLPKNIGEIRRNSTEYTFRSLKPDFFPEMEGEIKNCLGKTITIVTPDHRTKVFFVFRTYISKLEQLNKRMHLTDNPGPSPLTIDPPIH